MDVDDFTSHPEASSSGASAPPGQPGEVQVVRALVPPQAGVGYTDDYIATHTVLSTPSGHIFTTMGSEIHHNGQPNHDDFNKLSHEYGFDEVLPQNFSTITRKCWQIMQFRDMSDGERIFALLQPLCDILAVGITGVGACSAMYRRKSYVKPNFTDINIVKFYTPKLNGRHTADDVMFNCITSWLRMQSHVKMSFRVHVPNVSADVIMSEWQNRTDAEVQMDIIACCVKHKRRVPTPRERFVAENHVNLMKLRKFRLMTPDLSIIKASCEDIPSIQMCSSTEPVAMLAP